MKRRRSAPKSRPTKRTKTVAVVPANVMFPGPGRRQQFFVPRSFGNPRAVTERKYFTALRAAIAIPAVATDWSSTELDPATTNCLFAPVTGDDFLNRDGRKVQVLAIKIKATINVPTQADQSGADNASQIRILLVQDKQTNATQLNGEDVLQAVASNVINSFQNPAFFGRFKVMKDKMFVLQNPTISWDGTNIEQSGLTRAFKINHKFRKPVVVHFNATNGGTVADIIDNSFHILGGCSSTNLAPTLAYNVRVTFIDL